MTVQALYDEFQKKCALDPELRALKQKIESGSADFNDTAAYSQRVSKLLGKTLSKHIDGLPAGEREKICKWLLQEQYKDTNSICDVVQKALDEAQGIHLNPVKPKFPAERVQQVAHALEDPTVKPEVIQRRANAPVANVNMSFHDDYIKENAKIRAKLGLKPTITRYGTGCCKWCSEVAGRYRFGEQPEGVFRRHDNCNCTIIYDTQVLRGHENEDGGRSKKWEVIEDFKGFKPTVFSKEQAAKINENAQDGLTLAGERDIITGRGSGTGSDFGEHTFEKIGNVDPNDKKAVAALLAEFERKYRDSPIEHCRVITADGEVYEVHGGKYTVNTTLLGDKMAGSTNEHNHVTGESQYSFSWDDLRESVDDHSKVVIAYDERYRYHMIFPDNNLDPDYVSDVYQMAENSVGNDLIFHPELIPEGDEQHERIRRACEKLGIEYARKEIPR